MNNWLITLMIFLPVLGVLGQILLNDDPKGSVAGLARVSGILSSVLASLCGMALVAKLYGIVSAGGKGEIVEKLDWVGSFAISYEVSVDGLNALLVLLISLIFPVLIISEWRRSDGARGLFSLLLLLQSSLYGIACAQDLFLLFFFWMMSSLPFYFLLSLWGDKRRESAAFRYMMTAAVGNALLFGSILLVYYSVDPNTFLLAELAGGRLNGVRFEFLGTSLSVAPLAFGMLCFAMALRIPVWPLHSWFSFVMTQAPPSVAVALAGGFVPVAVYAFFRIAYSLFPFSLSSYSAVLVGVGVLNVVIGAVCAAGQRKMRLFLAFLCLAQTGLLLVGISSLDSVGVVGAVYQLFAFGLGISGLGLFLGLLRERTERMGIDLDATEPKYGGFARHAPVMAVIMAMVLASLLGFPGFGGFVSQALIFMGGYSVHPAAVLVIGFGALLMTLAFFSMYMRVFLGKTPDGVAEIQDLSSREKGYLLPVVVVLVILGVYPKPLLDMVKPSVAALLYLIKT